MEIAPSTLLAAIYWDIQFRPLTSVIVYEILAIVILLLLSALVSGSEVAYFSLSPDERLQVSNNPGKEPTHLEKNLESPKHLLATILIISNLINISIIVLSNFTISSLIDFTNEPILGFIAQVLIISILILLFCEIIPKVYSSHNSLKFARFMATPLYYSGIILKPFSSILVYSTSFIDKRIHTNNGQISVDELSQALELTSKTELKDDTGILKSIVSFGSKSVAEIMRSRVDVVSIDISSNFNKVIRLITDTGFSRIPVFSGTFDQIKGILYIKDLLPHVHKGATFRWQSTIRPPFYVPETKKIDDLLEEFQKNKVHMAIVVDEYGGTSGIVTLEDILEEIVGEITDEFDEDENPYTKINENTYLFDGKTLLNDFYRIIELEDGYFDDVKGEADTLAGLILELKGEMPAKGDTTNCKNYVFTIEAVDNRRIKQIKVETKKTETL